MSAFSRLSAAVALALAPPVAAQDHSMHQMPGMKMPATPTAKPAAKPQAKRSTKPRQSTGAKAAPKPTSPQTDPHAGHAMPGMAMPAAPAQAAPHAGHDMSGMPGPMGATTPDAMGTRGTALPPGNTPAPAAPAPNYADRVYSPAAMARARADLRREHGGAVFGQVAFNLAEVQIRDGRDGYRWDGEAWFGGDIDRVTIKSEGRGDFGRAIDDAEVQALYSRAIGPYFNLQAGVRHDFAPSPSRSYATIGFEGLAPYWFDVEGALFLSDKGDLLARLEGYYDQRITQRLILQPRTELNFAAQDVPESGIGAGLSDVELGLRLRYELAREFAPYVGVSYDRKLGDSARFARAESEDVGGASVVLGVRTWF